jgi:glycosyltransferase involved in cell wall biosynthesis
MGPELGSGHSINPQTLWIYGATNASELSGTPFFFYEQFLRIAQERGLGAIKVDKIALTRSRRLPFAAFRWMLQHNFSPKAYRTFKLSGLYQTASFNAQQQALAAEDAVISFTQILPQSLYQAASSGLMPVYAYIDLTLTQYFKTYAIWDSIPWYLKDELIQEERRCYGVATKIFCFHNGVKQSLQDDYGLSPSRVVVAESGANFSWAQISSGRERRAKRAVSSGVTLGFVGKDFQRKGLGKIINAIDMLSQAQRELVALHVVGPDLSEVPNRPYLTAHGFIDKLNDFEGFLEVLSKCDFGILLSEAEGFPGSILEFLSLGIPVITSDLEQIVERIEGKGSCIIRRTDGAATLVRLLSDILSDPLVRSRLETAAAAHRDDYTWRKPVSVVMHHLSEDGCLAV